jgi:hypothetical protein
MHGNTLNLRWTDPDPKRIVPINAILSQACRLTVNLKQQIPDGDNDSDTDTDLDESETEAETSNSPVCKLWFTAGLTRVRSRN